jgi:hypothetical protein
MEPPHTSPIPTAPYVDALDGGSEAWQLSVTHFFSATEPRFAGIVDLDTEVTVIDVPSPRCAAAVKAAVGPPAVPNAKPTVVPNLPAGWRAVQRPGHNVETRGVTVAGCQLGTLVTATARSPFHNMPDSRIAASASRLASAIAGRGFALRADTTPASAAARG